MQIMKKRFSIYLIADQRSESPSIIEHFIGHIWLPRIKKSVEPSKKLKLPCQLSQRWIKERVFFKVINLDEKNKIVYVVIVPHEFKKD